MYRSLVSMAQGSLAARRPRLRHPTEIQLVTSAVVKRAQATEQKITM
jgi:hypothetical protein